MESESVLLVKQEVYIYKIPPIARNRGYKAADWNLTEPTWIGRLRLVAKGRTCNLKLEDKENGSLFANCPIITYPCAAIEAVSDSSRYFVIRVQDGNERSAFLGLGFNDRSDSFDFNVALMDHFKWVKNQEEIEKEKTLPKKELNLALKEGETIKINKRITKRVGSQGSSRSRKFKSTTGILPPPPGGLGKIASPPATAIATLASDNIGTTGNELSGNESATTSQDQDKKQNSKMSKNWIQF